MTALVVCVIGSLLYLAVSTATRPARLARLQAQQRRGR